MAQQQWRKQLPRHLYAFGSGVAAGGTIGAVGWGGAQVLIPSLTANTSFAGYSQLSATGLALTSLSCSTFSTGWEFFHENKVHTGIALMVGLPAVVSARVGTQLAKRLSGETLELIFNTLSIILIPTHFWIQERAKEQRRLMQKEQPNKETTSPKIYDYHDPQILLQFGTFGLVSGMSSALMGVGGLPLNMSFLTIMTDLEHHIVQGTAVCTVIPSIIMSAASRITVIPLATAGVICAGTTLGGYLGAKLALYLDDEELRNLYMVSLVLFGGRSVYGAIMNLRQILLRAKKEVVSVGRFIYGCIDSFILGRIPDHGWLGRLLTRWPPFCLSIQIILGN